MFSTIAFFSSVGMGRLETPPTTTTFDKRWQLKLDKLLPQPAGGIYNYTDLDLVLAADTYQSR